ncbi:MAG: hypothetical protein R8M37_00305 [Alphaproteobacteria bacterium]|nr:hypothetical protein [Alphaproteobacteria bacterium]
MKVKNIMFTGFMAAILGATSANAAISVASTGYVDNKVAPLATSQSVTDLSNTVANTYQTKQDAATMQSAIDARVTTETYEAHLQAQALIDKKQTEDIASNLGKIEALDEASGGNITGIVTRLDTLEGDASKEGSVAYDIAAALAEANNYTDAEVKELAEGAVATNTSNIAKNAEDIVKNAQDIAKNAQDIETKADKATTLAGYGITNAFTKEETQTQISNSISGLSTDLTDAKATIAELPTKYALKNTVEEAEQTAINTAEQNAKDFTTQQIATLDSNGTAAAGSVLSGVTMVDGKITEVQQVALGKLATANVPAECTNESGTMCVLAVTPSAEAEGGFVYSWTPITENQ